MIEMKPKKLVQFWEASKTVQQIDRKAVSRGINRSAYIRQAVRKALQGAQK